jgi:hypothetical protein
MAKFIKIKNIDFLGFIASTVCAVHCTVVPIVFSIGLIDLGDLHHNHLFDLLVVGLGIIIASSSIIKDYLRYKVKTPLILCVLGITGLLLGLTGHDTIYQVSSVIGGSTLALSHLLNWRFNHKACKTY